MVGYSFYYYPIYSYRGFIYEPNVLKIIEGVIFIVLTVSILPASFKKPSDSLFHILFLFPVVPMIVLYGTCNFERSYIYHLIRW